MPRVMLMALFAGVTFAAAAAGSWFMKNQGTAVPAEQESSASPSLPPIESSSMAAESPAIRPDGELPVAVRPRPMSVEEILRFGMGLHRREKQLNEREAAIKVQEQQLGLALADVQGEQQRMEGLQAAIDGRVETCRALLTEIEQARAELQSERQTAEAKYQEFSDVRIESDAQELQNIKRMSEWFQGMEPEKAAGALKELANDGKTELAVKLLANFEERDAAKILSALDDYALMVDLAERFKDLKHPEKKPRR